MVLYLIADAVSSGIFPLPAWGVAAVALAISLASWTLTKSIEDEVAGARRVSLLGAVLGVAIASRLRPDGLSLIADLMWVLSAPTAGALVLELAFVVPDRAVGRFLYFRTFVPLSAVIIVLLATASALPGFDALGDFVLVSSVFAWLPTVYLSLTLIAALLLRFGRRAGGSVETALAANSWAIAGILPSLFVGVALGSLFFSRLIAERSWIAAALLAVGAVSVLYGHATLVDPERRISAGEEIRRVVAAVLAIALVAALAAGLRSALPDDVMLAEGAMQYGPAASAAVLVVVALAFFAALVLTQKLVRFALAPARGRLLDAIDQIDLKVTDIRGLDDLGPLLLLPLRGAAREHTARVMLYVVDPDRSVHIDAAGMGHVTNRPPPEPLLTYLAANPREIAVRRRLESRVVRAPSLRGLVSHLVEQDALCAVPLVIDEQLEGALVIPRGSRSAALTLEELDRIEALGRRISAIVSMICARDRARHREADSRREAERLAEELDQARSSLARVEGDLRTLTEGRGASRSKIEPIAYSPAMRRLAKELEAARAHNAPVLLVAEGGLPVDRVARSLSRPDETFLVVDCGASDAEEAIFGDATGATAALRLAGAGTVLIADLPALRPNAQESLALSMKRNVGFTAEGDEYSVECRIIACARQPLATLERLGAIHPACAKIFSEREIVIPPLRDRGQDIPSLVLLALHRACRVHGVPAKGITQDAIDALLEHDWPGNLRELQHVIDRSVMNAETDQVTREDLLMSSGAPREAAEPGPVVDEWDGTYAQLEAKILTHAMEISGGNKSEAARRLGLKRTTFLDKLRRVEQVNDDVA